MLDHLAPVRLRVEDLEREGENDHSDHPDDDGLETPEAALLEPEDGERPSAGEQPRWKQWNPEEQVEAEGRTDHLGHVTRCRHDLGLNP